MRTSAECLSCFIEQAMRTVSLCTSENDIQKLVAEEAQQLVATFDRAVSPPENAVALYSMIASKTGVLDPYEHLRVKSNRLALDMRAKISREIESSENPFKTAVKYAVAANIIDYGTNNSFDALEALSGCMQKDFLIDDSEAILRDIKRVGKGCKVLYLADNSGEIVFDGLLVEQLQNLKCHVTFAVREKPILNDVTLEDALECGLDKICRVITNGTGCPGTPLSSCSESFKSVFRSADVIISKGQGNFETLSDTAGPIYFLLTVKCLVVGKHIAVMRCNECCNDIRHGEMILMKRNKKNAGSSNS